MTNNNKPVCKFCSQTLNIETYHLGSIQKQRFVCGNNKCASGFSGLFIIREMDSDGELIAATSFDDQGSFNHGVIGAPSQNESNVKAVTDEFATAISRHYQLKFVTVTIGDHPAIREEGYDSIIKRLNDNQRYKIQITRGLPKAEYKEQGKEKRRDISDNVYNALKWLLGAIEHKKTRAAKDIVLLIDGLDAPFLGIITDLIVPKTELALLEKHGWHSIWVITPFGARKIVGEDLIPSSTTD